MDTRSFFRGTSADQDDRFANKEKKLLKSMKFPAIFNQKVDITKVHLPSFKIWMNNQTKLIGIDDDLLVDYVYELLEAGNPDPKVIQINITGFLESNTSQFMIDLWTLLVEAQNCEGGIPSEFLKDIAKSSLQVKNEEERIKEALYKTKIKIENAHLQDQKIQSYGLQHNKDNNTESINNVQKYKGVSKWDDIGPPTISPSTSTTTTTTKINSDDEGNKDIDKSEKDYKDSHKDSPDRKRDRDYYDRKERDYYDSYKSTDKYYSRYDRRYDDRRYESRDSYNDRRYDDRRYDDRRYEDRRYDDRRYDDRRYDDRRYESRDSYHDRRYDDKDSYSDRRDKDSYHEKKNDDKDYYSKDNDRKDNDRKENDRKDNDRKDNDRKDSDRKDSDRKDRDYEKSSNVKSKPKYSDDESDYKTDTRIVKKRKEDEDDSSN